MGLVFSWALLRAILDALTALVTGPGQGGSGSGGFGCNVLVGGTVFAYTNAPVLTQSMNLGQFVEPTYPGYARQPLTWEFERKTTDQTTWQGIAMDVIFQPSAAGTPQTIIGYGILSSDGATVLAAEQLANPYVLNGPGDALIFEPEIQVPLGFWGSATVKL